ncbi:MAG: hypothetical protein ACRENG_36815 [bacterium]
MSVLELTEQDLKTQLVQELDKFDREQLLMIHQFVSRLIAESLIKDVTKDWETGTIGRAAIQKAIRDHRAKQPYGESES